MQYLRAHECNLRSASCSLLWTDTVTRGPEFHSWYNPVKCSPKVLTKANPLSDQHIEILNSVIAKFKTFTAKDISDYSHEELAYSDTNQNEPISYEYALKLKSN